MSSFAYAKFTGFNLDKNQFVFTCSEKEEGDFFEKVLTVEELVEFKRQYEESPGDLSLLSTAITEVMMDETIEEDDLEALVGCGKECYRD